MNHSTVTATPFIGQLVAHRGDQEQYVENTLQAFQQAALAGALYVECDIQFSQDLIPVVIHDDGLNRLCGMQKHISKLSWQAVQQLETPFEISSLATLLHWLEKKPGVTLFLEVKPDILKRLSPADVAELLFQFVPKALSSQVVFISESSQILTACLAQTCFSLGWVAEGGDFPDVSLEQKLDYVFMPFLGQASIQAWHQKGLKVGIYTINDVRQVEQILGLGADLVETNHFSRMMKELKP